MTENLTKKERIKFYMNITNGHLIRPTDGYLKLQKRFEYLTEKDYIEKNKQVIQSFIDDFNNKQDIDIQNKGTKEFENHFYFNSNSACDTLVDNQWIEFCKNEGRLSVEEKKPETTWSH